MPTCLVASASSQIPFRTVVALAATMMIGAFSLDTYLPAFPAIARDLGVDTQQVSLSISVYIFSLAFAQLIGGALSDRYGRRPILMWGLGIYTVASLALATVHTLPLFLLARAVQAVGGGWALVSVPALVRDLVKGVEAAKLFSLMGLIAVAAPGIAPSVGSALLAVGPWTGIFLTLAVYGFALAILVRQVIFGGNTFVAAPRGADARPLVQRYADVLRQPGAKGFILWAVGIFSVMMMWVSSASFIYQEHFGLSENTFALLFATNIAVLFLANAVNRAALATVRPLRLLQIATGMQGTAATFVLLAAWLDWPLWAFIPSIALTIGAHGAITPNLQACYMEQFHRDSGTAAALMGAAQFGLAGVITAVAAGFLPQTLPAIASMLAACSALAVGLTIRSVWREAII